MASANATVCLANTQVPPIVSDLEAIFEELPDEALIGKLRGPRRRGRPAHDPEKLWRAFVAYYNMGLPSVSDLIRTLQDNPYIAAVCGYASRDEIPHQSTFSRFGIKLSKRWISLEVKNILRTFTRRMFKELPEFGKSVAIDSTDVKAWSNGNKKGKNGTVSDPDAGWVAKKNARGNIRYVFGYKVHILCDITWELPIAVSVTRGNYADVNAAAPLLQQARYTYGEFNPDYVICDAGYSSEKLRKAIKQQCHSVPIIDPNPGHKRLVAKTPKTAE